MIYKPSFAEKKNNMRNPKQGGGASGKMTPCCSKVGIKRGPWTAEEDEILAGYIKRDGEGAWRTLPKRAGLLRCGKSCRLRWMNYLRPHLNRGPISPDEEDLILRLHRLLGNRWSLIAGRIPGRTDNEIKNFWNTHLSKKLISQGLDPRTHKPLEVYNPNPNDNCSSVYEHTYNNNNNHGVRSSPIEDVNPNPNPISATSTTPVMLNRSEACTTTNNHGAADGLIMVPGYANTIHGFDSSRGEIQDYNDEMFSSFLDSLIVNEECVFQQTSVINDHQIVQDEFMMQSIGYGTTSQGFNDHCGSVWGSEVSFQMGTNNQRDQGKCNRNLDPADVHRH